MTEGFEMVFIAINFFFLEMWFPFKRSGNLLDLQFSEFVPKSYLIENNTFFL